MEKKNKVEWTLSEQDIKTAIREHLKIPLGILVIFDFDMDYDHETCNSVLDGVKVSYYEK